MRSTGLGRQLRQPDRIPAPRERVLTYIRLRQLDVTDMTETRGVVREHVETHPGVYFNELTRDLDIATGQAQYHLRRLLDSGVVDSEAVRGRTHYFPTGYDPWERRTIALLHRETVRSIIVYTLEVSEASATELTEELGVARSTVSWHVSTLVEADIAEKVYDQQGRSHIRLTRPEETRDLLGEVTPSLPERLVDRFTRLVDANFTD